MKCGPIMQFKVLKVSNFCDSFEKKIFFTNLQLKSKKKITNQKLYWNIQIEDIEGFDWLMCIFCSKNNAFAAIHWPFTN